MLINLIKYDVCEALWDVLLATEPKKRPGYIITEESVTIPQISHLILGCDVGENDYNNKLYNMYKNAEATGTKVYLLTGNLDKSIESAVLARMKKILAVAPALSPKRLLAFLVAENIICPNLIGLDYVCSKLLSILNILSRNFGFKGPEFERIFIDLVKWQINHINKMIGKMNDIRFPMLIWYGEFTLSVQYFLCYLMELGFDVVIFAPDGKNYFTEFGDNLQVTHLSSTCASTEFPLEKPRISHTVAYMAERRISGQLFDLAIKPWQFREHLSIGLSMRTTIDELGIWWDKEARLRPNFYFDEKVVELPVFFAVVNGIHEKRSDYVSLVTKICSVSGVMCIDQLPFSIEKKEKPSYHLPALIKNGKMKPKDLQVSPAWRYQDLHDNRQFSLALAISEYIELLEHDLKAEAFDAVMRIDEKFINMLKAYDYGRQIPKIVILQHSESGYPSRNDAHILGVLNMLGFDIIIFNPSGEKTIDDCVPKNNYQSFWLDNMSFNEATATMRRTRFFNLFR